MSRAIKILLYLLSLLLFQEVTLRFFFPLPEVKNLNRIHYVQGEIGEDPDKNTKPVRSIKLALISSPDSPDEFIHNLNFYGFRGGGSGVWQDKREEGEFFLSVTVLSKEI